MPRLLVLVAASMFAAFALAFAQGSPVATTQRIETAFADAETLRFRGECKARAAKMADLAAYLIPFTAPTATGFSAEAKAEYRTRLSEATLRPCPAGYPTPSEPPAVVATPLSAPGPTPQSEVAVLAGELEGACGDQWSVLRLRMLAALDRAILVEGNSPRARDFSSARAALLRRDPPICEKPAPVAATAGPAHDRYVALATKAEGHLSAARTAQANGNCARFRSQRSAANLTLGMMRGTKYVPPQPDPLIAAIEAMRILPCPAPRPPIVARCANTYKNHREAGLPLTCRCAGPDQFLMTWGTDIYLNGSSICNAAIHVGAISQNGIGTIRLIPVARADRAKGTVRNGVSTYDWNLETADGFGVTPVQD